MGAERVDYCSDDEYRQALQYEEQEYYYYLQQQAEIEQARWMEAEMGNRKEKIEELTRDLYDTVPPDDLEGTYEELFERYEVLYDKVFSIAEKAIQLLKTDD